MSFKADNGFRTKVGRHQNPPGLKTAPSDQSYEARLGLPRHKRPGSRK